MKTKLIVTAVVALAFIHTMAAQGTLTPEQEAYVAGEVFWLMTANGSYCSNATLPEEKVRKIVFARIAREHPGQFVRKACDKAFEAGARAAGEPQRLAR